MIYLIGGVPRAGKTTVAKVLMENTGIPYFSLDYLMMSIAKGMPELGVDPNNDELIVAERLLHLVNPMITTMIENGIDYILEGAQLIPRHVSELSSKYPGIIRACFMGFSEDDSMRKSKELENFSSLSENDWLKNYSEAELFEEAERLISLSREIRKECVLHGVTYFEIDGSFTRNIETIVKYMVNGE